MANIFFAIVGELLLFVTDAVRKPVATDRLGVPRLSCCIMRTCVRLGLIRLGPFGGSRGIVVEPVADRLIHELNFMWDDKHKICLFQVIWELFVVFFRNVGDVFCDTGDEHGACFIVTTVIGFHIFIASL